MPDIGVQDQISRECFLASW